MKTVKNVDRKYNNFSASVQINLQKTRKIQNARIFLRENKTYFFSTIFQIFISVSYDIESAYATILPNYSCQVVLRQICELYK